jgi:hypothetical protein
MFAGSIRLWFCLLAGVAMFCGCENGEAPVGKTEVKTSAKSAPHVTEDQLRLARLPDQQHIEATQREPRADDWFEEVTAQSGIEFAYRNGCEAGLYTLLETIGGGLAMLDYDRDGDMDLFFAGGGGLTKEPLAVQGRSSALFRNEGQWRFTDVTTEAGFGAEDLYTHGCAVGDYDRDGFPDILLSGYGGCRLYRNQQGKSFADETTASGLDCPGWNTAVAWADFDRDGWLDLYITRYLQWKPADRTCVHEHAAGNVRDVCGPYVFDGAGDQLWRNRGSGTFEEVTDAAGLATDHRGLGVVAADFDEDGWIDFYVVNDTDENDLYLGGPNLPFDSVGALAGVAFDPLGIMEGSMGVDAGDFDGDGQADLFCTNYEREDNSLMRKVGPRDFLNVSDTTGLIGKSRSYVGWGTGFADFDSDGWLDLFVMNGHALYERPQSPYFQPAQLLHNQQGRRFEEITDRAGPYFSVPHAGRGAAVGDLDDDGGLDLVIVHQNDPVTILRNRQPPEHWVRLALRGETSNPSAIGAKVTVDDGARMLTRWIRGGGGYLSHFDARIVVPLPSAEPAEVNVVWPSGKAETFSQLAAGETHELVEGCGQSQ